MPSIATTSTSTPTSISPPPPPPPISSSDDTSNKNTPSTPTRKEYEILSNKNRELTLRLQEKELELTALEESLRKEFEERERDSNSKSKSKSRWTPFLCTKDGGGVGQDGTTPASSPLATPYPPPTDAKAGVPQKSFVSELSRDSVSRYSRQLLLNDGFGVEGQKKLLSSSVLVVGAGGLGSTALLYLAASGLSNITVLDPDTVELSNLHRQIIHSDPTHDATAAAPKPKALSASEAIAALNPTVRCTPVVGTLDWDNALEMVEGHDVVVDASDNPRTRYLLNDACVLANGGGGGGGVPLVSGSAMGTEGQLSLYNVNGDSGCYRCMYPVRPPSSSPSADGCKSCNDNGVLGTVPGLIGVLQATEVIKLLTGIGETMENHLVMYDALRCSFVRIKKRTGRRMDCVLCGKEDGRRILSMEDSRDSLLGMRGPAAAQPVVTAASCVPCDKKQNGKNDNATPTPIAVIDSNSQSSSSPEVKTISCQEYHQLRQKGDSHVLIDVRDPRQYEMCSLEGSINIPLGKLAEKEDDKEEDGWKRVRNLSGGTKPVYCICRRGVASATATKILTDNFSSMGGGDDNGGGGGGAEQSNNNLHSVYNIIGGYTSWAKEVDPSFPSY